MLRGRFSCLRCRTRAGCTSTKSCHGQFAELCGTASLPSMFLSCVTNLLYFMCIVRFRTMQFRSGSTAGRSDMDNDGLDGFLARAQDSSSPYPLKPVYMASHHELGYWGPPVEMTQLTPAITATTVTTSSVPTSITLTSQAPTYTVTHVSQLTTPIPVGDAPPAPHGEAVTLPTITIYLKQGELPTPPSSQ